MTLSNAADNNNSPVTKTLAINVIDPLNLSVNSNLSENNAVLGTPADFTISGMPDGVSIVRAYWNVRQSNAMAADGMYQVDPGADILNRKFTFTEPGIFIVSVSVTDSRGVTGFFNSSPVTVIDYPPVINSLTADTLIGPPPMAVTFTADASDTNPGGTVVNYIWNLTGSYVENGLTSYVNERFIYNTANRPDNNPNVLSYTFGKEGKYTVSLTAEDDIGRKSQPSEINVQVLFRAPVISSVQANPYSGTAPFDCALSAQATDIDSDDNTLTYAWDIGADGVIDSTAASFSHRFDQEGSYEIQLTVTDIQGLSATRKFTIYALASDSQRAFNFRQLWGNKLADAYDFNVQSSDEPYHGDSKRYILKVGDQTQPISIPQFEKTTTSEGVEFNPAGNTLAPVPTVDLVPGLNGLMKEEWGSLTSFLFDFPNNGNYDVGLRPALGSDKKAKVRFPETYDCGYFYYSSWPNSYTYYEGNEKGVFDLYFYDETSDSITSDGKLRFVAKLGTKDGQGVCQTAYYGAASIGAWPIANPETPPEYTLTQNDAINTKTVVIPAGYTFDNAVMILDGIRTTFSSYSLDTYANGNVPIPYVSGAAYEIRLTADGSSGNKVLTAVYSVQQAMDTMVFEPDASGIVSMDIALEGDLMGASQAEFIFTGTNRTMSTQINFTQAITTLPGVQVLKDAKDLTIIFSKNGQHIIKYKQLQPSSLTGTLNLDTFTGVALPSNVALTMDTTAKTLTINFESDAPICRIDVYAKFGTSYPTASQTYHFIVPGKAGQQGIIIDYPLPEMSDPYGGTEPVPSRDDITSAEVIISAVHPSDSYEGFIRNLLGKFGLLNYDWSSYPNLNFFDIQAANTSTAKWGE